MCHLGIFRSRQEETGGVVRVGGEGGGGGGGLDSQHVLGEGRREEYGEMGSVGRRVCAQGMEAEKGMWGGKWSVEEDQGEKVRWRREGDEYGLKKVFERYEGVWKEGRSVERRVCPKKGTSIEIWGQFFEGDEYGDEGMVW